MDPIPSPDQQILIGTPATLAVTWRDQTGEPAAASGSVHVSVTDANGTELVASTAATAGADVGEYTYALAVAANDQLAVLTATWTDADSAMRGTLIEVVGGFWFTTADAVAAEPSMSGRDDLLTKRREVELEAERIIGWSFVPRYNRAIVDGSGDSELLLPDLYLRKVRSVTVLLQNGATRAFTQAEIDELLFPRDGVIRRPGSKGFDPGFANVIVEYEHGWDRPPEDLQRASITRLRYRMNSANSGIADRATSYTDPASVQTIRIAPAGPGTTGMPDVDAVYQGYSAFYDGGSGPASRSFDYDPTEEAVYHGWRR